MRPDVNDFDGTRRLYREAKRNMLHEMGAKLSGSWRWAAPEFETALEQRGRCLPAVYNNRNGVVEQRILIV